MMNAHLKVVLRQQLPEKPNSAQFLAGLVAATQPRQGPSTDEALFGDTFSKVTMARGGQKKTQQGSIQPLKDFQKVLDARQVTIENLDEYFTAFAKWCLNVECLFDTKEEQDAALGQRQQLCANAGVKVRSWLPSSMRTMLNGAASLYKTAEGKGSVCPSEPTLFPNYNDFFNCAYRRERAANARKAEAPVLDDVELEELFDKTNWQSPFEAQRTNLLILCFSLGERTSTIEELCVGNFHRQPTADNSSRLWHAVCLAFGVILHLLHDFLGQFCDVSVSLSAFSTVST
jgi:hypothetical protein